MAALLCVTITLRNAFLAGKSLSAKKPNQHIQLGQTAKMQILFSAAYHDNHLQSLINQTVSSIVLSAGY